jgi:glycosyltransferase involved in cell wall biosynthesis
MAHILLLPSWYKTPAAPVTGTFFEEQARMLQRQGHQVGVLFPHHAVGFFSRQRGHLESEPVSWLDNGLPTYYAFTESPIPKYGYPTRLDVRLLQKKAWSRFQEYVRVNGKPDFLHAHSVLWGGVAAQHISARTGIPFVLTEHFSGWVRSAKRKGKSIFRNSLIQTVKESWSTLVVSSSFRDALLEHYPLSSEKLSVVPNVVNPIFHEHHRPRLLTKPAIIAVIGNLKPGKNHITLFEAIRQLKKKGQEVILQVVGDGSERQCLEEFIRSHGLGDTIRMLGVQTREEVLAVLQQSHLLVSASVFETFGVNIAEALAVGRPVVALDSGGPRDIIKHPADGILLQKNTPEGFVGAIEKVLAEYDRYDQEAISKRCIERFGESPVYRLLEKHYEAILSK